MLWTFLLGTMWSGSRNFVPAPRTVCYSAREVRIVTLVLVSSVSVHICTQVCADTLIASHASENPELACLRQCTMYMVKAIFLSCSSVCIFQCCGSVSESVEPLCFWASRIRIRQYLYGSGSFHQQGKKVRKTLFFTNLWRLFWLFIYEDWYKFTFKKQLAKKN